jgi:hypothetical protein
MMIGLLLRSGYHVIARQPNHSVYFQRPDGTCVMADKVGCPVTFKPLGIDIKGVGGYVMAADTVLTDGQYYELVQGSLSEVPPLFPWLVEMIQAGKQTDTDADSTAPMGSPLMPAVRRVVTDVAYNVERADAYMQTLFDLLVTDLASCPDGMRNSVLNSAVFRRLARWPTRRWRAPPAAKPTSTLMRNKRATRTATCRKTGSYSRERLGRPGAAGSANRAGSRCLIRPTRSPGRISVL